MFDPVNDLAHRLADERPVVVMGRGHSGTRVLAWALEALGVRMGTLEEKPTGDVQDRRFTRRIKRVARRYVPLPPDAEPRPSDVRRLRRAAGRYLEWLEERSGGTIGPLWGWKFPETYLIGNVVDRIFPAARYVHMVRDGRDLAFKAHLTDDAGRGLGRAILAHLGVLDRPRPLQAAISWDWQVRRFDDFARTIATRVHAMTFEELVLDPQATTERLCEFLEVPMNDSCRDYLRANLHREEDPERIREVEAAIAPTLRRFGYEVDLAAPEASRTAVGESSTRSRASEGARE